MIRGGVIRPWRVRIFATITLPCTAGWLWQQMHDIAHFATFDPFHARLDLHGPAAVGTPITLHHNYAGFRLTRTGRILQWRDGLFYSFSDLSSQNPTVRFPHVYRYTLLPIHPTSTRLTIEVRGTWTARFLPRPLVNLWLRWTMLFLQTKLRTTLLRRLVRHSRTV